MSHGLPMESKHILRETIKDTVRVFGGLPWVLTILVLPWPGFAVHRLIAGAEPMREEILVWFNVSLAGTAVMLVCVILPVFLWRLWLAPYRILSERLHSAEETLAKQQAIEARVSDISAALSAVQAHVSGLPDGQAYHQTLICLRETTLGATALAPIEQRMNELQGDLGTWQVTVQELDRMIADIKAEVHGLQSRSGSEGKTPH